MARDAVETRAATPQDAEALARFVMMAGEGLPRVLWARMAGPGETPEDVGRRRALRDEGAFSWRNARVAEIGGEVVAGIVGYRLPDAPEPVDPETPAALVPAQELENLAPGRWYVNVLAVDPPMRRRSVGRALLEEAEARARAEGLPGIAIIIFATNAGARRLYEGCGYREAARRDFIPMEGWAFDGDAWVLLVKDFA